MARLDLMHDARAILVRQATFADVPVLERLIVQSAGALCAGYYTPEQTTAAIEHVFGVDSELIEDGTYFVAEDGGEAIACGGWSRRQTLFGGDGFAERNSEMLQPGVDAARIRAFFVAPGHARRGLAAALLRHCQVAAAEAGFTALQLMATLPGVPFYRAAGFNGDRRTDYLAGGTVVPFVAMRKQLPQPSGEGSTSET